MPEGLEVEIYRRAAARLIGRRIVAAQADERVADPLVVDELVGLEVVGARRIGKLLLVDTDDAVIGVHFGMTGRIVVDDVAPIEQLEYGARRDDPRWDRVVVDLDDGGSMRVSDPRRWSRIELDPDEDRFGPDLFEVTLDELRRSCVGRRRAVKSVLLDQSCVAGLGNMCVDEVLFTAGIDPRRPAGELEEQSLAALHRAMRERLPAMLAAGGSHRGVLSPEVRAELPLCLHDGAPLERCTVGGRTTVWCPQHQR